MRELVPSPKFKRAYRKFVRRFPHLREKINEAFFQMEIDVYSFKLQTHKLSGKLYGAFACSCGFDCRIVFSIENDSKTGNEFILLIDIGTHEEVY